MHFHISLKHCRLTFLPGGFSSPLSSTRRPWNLLRWVGGTVPPGRVAAQAGHGGAGTGARACRPRTLCKTGVPGFEFRRFGRCFRINIFRFSKKSCPQKCKMKGTSKDSNRGPLRYRSCIIRINQIVVVVHVGPFHGASPHGVLRQRKQRFACHIEGLHLNTVQRSPFSFLPP